MKLTLRIDIGDGPYEVTTNLGTVVAWERKFKRKASEMATAIGAEDLAFLAYEASKQAGVTVPATFDDFIKRCADVPEVVETESSRPTAGAPTDEH